MRRTILVCDHCGSGVGVKEVKWSVNEVSDQMELCPDCSSIFRAYVFEFCKVDEIGSTVNFKSGAVKGV